MDGDDNDDGWMDDIGEREGGRHSPANQGNVQYMKFKTMQYTQYKKKHPEKATFT